MIGEEIEDIDRLLEADLEELGDDALDDEPLGEGGGADGVQQLLLSRITSQSYEPSAESESYHDEITQMLMAESQKLFSWKDREHSVLNSQPSSRIAYSQEIDPVTDILPPEPEVMTAVLVTIEPPRVDETEESPEDIAERTRIVKLVVDLMVDSVEALANVFLRPAPELLAPAPPPPVDAIPLPVLSLEDREECIPEAAPITARWMTHQIEHLEKLAKDEESRKRENQLLASNFELEVKEAYDAEREQLAKELKLRQERQRLRMETIQRETSSRRIQRIWRGHVVRMGLEALRTEHRLRLEALEQQRVLAFQEEQEKERRRMEQMELARTAAEWECMEKEDAASKEYNAWLALMLKEKLERAAEEERQRQEQVRLALEREREAQAAREREEKERLALQASFAPEAAEPDARVRAPLQEGPAQHQQRNSAHEGTPARGQTVVPRPPPSAVNERNAHGRASGKRGPPALRPAPVEHSWGGVLNAAAWATPANVSSSSAQELEQNSEEETGTHHESVQGLPDDLVFESDYSQDSDDEETDRKPLLRSTQLNTSVFLETKEDPAGDWSVVTATPLPPLELSAWQPTSLATLPPLFWPSSSPPPEDITSTHNAVLDLPSQSASALASHVLQRAWQRWCRHFDRIFPRLPADLIPAPQFDGSGSDRDPGNSSHPSKNPAAASRTSTTQPASFSVDNEKLLEVEYSVEDVRSLAVVAQRFGYNLSKLVLNVNQLTDLQGVEQFVHLHTLSVRDNQLLRLPNFSALRNLQALHLDSNRIQDIQALNDHPSLQVLTVTCNALRGDLPPLRLPTLRRLDLYQNQLQSLQQPWKLPGLLSLNLGRNQLTAIDGRALSACLFLQTLVLSQNQLTEVPHPLRLACLTALWLNGNQLSSLAAWRQRQPETSQAPSVSTSSRCAAGNRGPDDGAGEAEDEDDCPLFLPQLQKLYLQDNQLTHLHAADLHGMPLLSELDLSFNHITSLQQLQGLMDLSLSQRSALSQLKLNDNPMTTTSTQVQRIIRVEAPCVRYPLALATAQSRQQQAQQRLRDAVDNHDWKAFFCGVFPCLKTLSGEDVGGRKDSIGLAAVPFDMRGPWMPLSSPVPPSLLSLYSRAAEESAEVDAGCPRLLMQCLQHMRAEADLVQHKMKKRSMQDKSSGAASKAAGHETDGDLDADSPTRVPFESKEDLQLQMSILQCQRLRQLHDASLRTRSPWDEGWCVDFRQAASLLPQPCKPLQATPASRTAIPQQGVDGLTPRKQLAALSAAATQIQRIVRGHAVRRRISSLFQHIRYEDDDLDDILNSNGPDDLLSSFLDLGDLDGDDLGIQGSARAVPAAAATVAVAHKTVAYGDHVRMRRSRENMDVPQNAWTAGLAELPKLPLSGGAGSADRVEERGGEDLAGASLLSHRSQVSRPQSTSSAVSAMTDASGLGHVEMGGAVDDDKDDGESKADSQQSHPRGGHKQHLQEEWGISDPRLLQALMKRSKRMKQFMHAPEHREKEKNSQVRYQRFVRSVNTGAGAHPHSKQATMRRGGQATHKVNVAPPAWMANSELS